MNTEQVNEIERVAGNWGDFVKALCAASEREKIEALECAAKQVCGGCRSGDPIPVATEHQNMDSMGFYPCKAIGILTMIDDLRRLGQSGESK